MARPLAPLAAVAVHRLQHAHLPAVWEEPVSLIDDLYGQQAEIARQQARAAGARTAEQEAITRRLEAEQALAVVAAERAADRNVLIFRLVLVLVVPATLIIGRVL